MKVRLGGGSFPGEARRVVDPPPPRGGGGKVMPSGTDRVKNEIFPSRYSSTFVTTKNACGHKPSLLPGTCEGRTVHQRCLLPSIHPT